jgi:hypothetical protein
MQHDEAFDVDDAALSDGQPLAATWIWQSDKAAATQIDEARSGCNTKIGAANQSNALIVY